MENVRQMSASPLTVPEPATICVATLTRNRPRMLRALLDSLSETGIPEDCRIEFLVVENGEPHVPADLIERFAASVAPAGVSCICEPRVGIPFARNTAIAFALRQGCDFLAFVDDDCTVAADWLVNLVGERRKTGADLVGGPVLPVFPEPLSFYRAQIARGIRRRYEAKVENARRRRERGGTGRTTIVTSNWLGHRSLFERHGLRFREEFAAGGGSDAQFDSDARALGIARSWASSAFVHEEIPLERIGFRYQFRRARDQSTASFQRKYARSPGRAVATFPVVLVPRLAGMIALAVLLPITAGSAYVALARNAGWIAGRIRGLFGGRSDLYAEVTGE